MFKKYVLCACLAFAFVACGEKQADPSIVTGRISMANDVKSWLKIERNVMQRDDYGLAHASLLFVNNSSKDKAFFYRITWFDSNGMAIPSIISTKTIVRMSPNDEKAVLIAAPNDKASSYSLNITSAK